MRSALVLLAIAALWTTNELHAADGYENDQRTSRRQLSTPTPAQATDWRVGDDAAADAYQGDDAQGAVEGECGDECCDDGCGGCHGCRLLGRHRSNRFREDEFNCGCNGSYKFPVPPLYTYHWPGMYSHQLMTDYHSPWRFPAIRPYRDEKPIQAVQKPDELRQASHLSPAKTSSAKRRVGGLEPMSAKMKRYYQQ